MDRINATSRYINLDRIRTALPYKLRGQIEQLTSLYEARNIDGMCRVIAVLEQNCRQRSELIPLFQVVCTMGLKFHNAVRLAEYALKTMPLADKELYESALGFLEQTAIEYPGATENDQEQIKKHLSHFLAVSKNQVAILDLSPRLQLSWTAIFEMIFPQKWLNLQLALIENIFTKTDEAVVKYKTAITYTLTARRVYTVDRNPVDKAKVRQYAEYILANFPEAMADRKSWDDSQFDTFVYDLATFELFDLVERAVQARKVGEKEAIAPYLGLLEKMQTDPVAAYLEVGIVETEIASRNPSDVLQSAIILLALKVHQRYFKSIGQSIDAAQQLLSAKTPFEKALLCSRPECEAIRNKIALLRARALQQFEPTVAASLYFITNAQVENVFADQSYLGFVAYTVDSGCVELFIIKFGAHNSVRVQFHLKRSESGKIIGIENSYSFDGVSKKDQKKLPLFWDYLVLRLLANSGNFEDNGRQVIDPGQIKEVEWMIDRLAATIASEENQARLVALGKEFLSEEIYRESELEMENCLRMAKSIVEAFVKTIRPFTYVLSSQDFLFRLIAVIRVLERQEKDGANIPVQLITVKDEEVNIRITPEGRVIAPDGKSKLDPLFEKYLAELFFGACAKKLTDFIRNEPGSGQGAIISQPDDADSDQVSGAYAALRQIYAAGFPKLVEQKGLLAFPWLYMERVGEDEVLFHPYPDQSKAAKQKLLNDQGGENIFIPTEPFGSIRVLPVSRRKKRNGQWEFRPKKRNPLREQQKGLLGDPSPLPVKYRLYIKTVFSDGTEILSPYALRSSEDEILSDKVFGKLQEELDAGEHAKDPKKLLKGTSGKRRKVLEEKITSGEITISSQETEAYRIDTTYYRPPIVSLKSQLGQGYELEGK